MAPGLIGFIPFLPIPSQKRLQVKQTMLASLQDTQQTPYEETCLETQGISAGCIHIGAFLHSITAHDSTQRIHVLLDGMLLPSENHPHLHPAQAAEFCLTQYQAHGIDFVQSLNGYFNLIICDEKQHKIFITNDRYGLRPLYFSVSSQGFYLAPRAQAILNTTHKPKALNLSMAVNMLSYGRIWIGQDSLFKDIHLLKPASLITFEHTGTERSVSYQTHTYWRYQYKPHIHALAFKKDKIDPGILDHAVYLFKNAVHRHTSVFPNHALTLTGGLDSRCVSYVCAQTQKQPLLSYTWSAQEKSSESEIAAKVAQKLGSVHHLVPLKPLDFLSAFNAGTRLLEGQDISIQSYLLKAFSCVQNTSTYAITGLALDVTLGGSYLSSSLLDKSNQNIAQVLQKACYFSPDETCRFFKHPDIQGLIENLEQHALQEFKSTHNEFFLDNVDAFYLQFRAWRYLFMRQNWQRLWVEDLIPTFDNDWIDFVMTIPYEWRMNHRFYREFIMHLCPDLAQIPYQRTLLPPSAPLEFWDQANALEQNKEQLYRQIDKNTQGKIRIPYERYYSNFDEWMRHEPAYRLFLNEMLLSQKSHCHEYIDKQYLERLITEHMRADKDHHKKLIQLLTFESFLREFFSKT